MRVSPCMLLLAVLCLSSTGCTLFNKKSGGSEAGPLLGANGKGPAKFPTGDPLLPAPNPVVPAGPAAASPTAAETALVAGRVVDGYNRPPSSATFIRWTALEDNKETANPADVRVTPEGYFTIQGLKPGGQYKLIARAKNGEKLVAGITYTQAPNVRVVIQVKEEFASPTTPPLPGSGGAADAQGEAKPAVDKSSDLGTRPPGAAAWAPSNPAIPGRPAAESDLPAQLNVPVPVRPAASAPTTTSAPSWVPGGVADPRQTWPPTLNLAPKKPLPAPTPPKSSLPFDVPKPPPLVPGETSSLSPARSPTCVLVGERIENLALNDTHGKSWDLHKDRRGRLVLIDFWATYCLPCREAMPKLSQLQSKFGPQGLEVVGVALEDSGTAGEQSLRVNKMCYQLQTNYRQLLGENHRTNLRGQFGISGIPSLVLVNRSGQIVWRHTGVPDQATIEHVIQRHLADQPF